MDASSSGWGAQLGSRSTQGQWSASQRSWHINVLEMQAVINAVRAFLPHLRLMCDNAVTVAYIKNEWGTRSYTLMQMTLHLLKWCDNFGSRPSARRPQHPGRFPVHSRPDTEHGVDDGHWAFTTSICPVGRTTGRLVCDVCQQMTYQVCITVSGPHGWVHGRHVSALGPREGPPVCLSAIQDGPSSSAEGPSVSRCSVDSDHSSAGNSFMVPRASGTVPRRSHPAVRRGSTAADSRCRADQWGDRD